ncbi:hypothetical protein NT6N_24810 [Oceaniferula spumae]|uniref:Uncharacterized protein n=1 Tax=Oceaniferula spumae TaxID=2979115 RepID=A0AAT9FNF1_9BACT
MPTWFHTYLQDAESVTDEAIESFIRSEEKDACSLAKDNGEYWFKSRNESDWVLVTPNGFQSIDEKYAESCRRMSQHFGCSVVMTMGQGNCSGMVFAVFEDGIILRYVAAVDGMLYANDGEPYDWEVEVFGDLGDQEVAISELTLSSVADRLGLPGYESVVDGDGYWAVERKIRLSSPPPFPK